ncbi:glycosyltransferase [Methylotuvimicrobium alcaliphilum]|uniref:Glycosyltransferase n=1 Tax=Methylotuvimicrobium alcaliphilum (strain DSM 19304 / NCIMB 14124 / VKM B-2133 / 20Z) TaxID=1091494 RepID=G4T1L4_META2|nr:glycosyltransferase [Methylotuvimicrobium alcaliphilum]CCE22436.1 putative glycosyltransferase [Methylotuvimicrobium alcaliphilum 20Z]
MIKVALMPQFFGWAGGLEFLRNISIGLHSVADKYDLRLVIALNHDFLNSPLYEIFTDYFQQITFSRDIIYYDAVTTDLAVRLQENSVSVVVAVNGDLGATFPVPWISYIPDFQHKYFHHLFTEHECFSRETAFAARLRDCKAMLVNAQAVKQDLQIFYPWINSKRIFVLPFLPILQPSWLDIEPTNAQRKYQLPKRYFIVCNQFWVHKDHSTAFRALAALKDTNVHLLCTGTLEDYRNSLYQQELKTLLDELKITERVHFLGHIPKLDQISLLKGAQALVQPTLFEGGAGGGATYDAVAVGVPVLLSDIAVNKEISIPHVQFFVAGDARHLAVLMEQLLRCPCSRLARSELLQQMHENQQRLGGALYKSIKYTLDVYAQLNEG